VVGGSSAAGFRWKKANPDRKAQIHSQTTAKVFYRSYLDSHDFAGIAFSHHNPDRHWFIDGAGWHCSYCFSAARIRKKIEGLGMPSVVSSGWDSVLTKQTWSTRVASALFVVWWAHRSTMWCGSSRLD
jgi:hypothetical protein